MLPAAIVMMYSMKHAAEQAHSRIEGGHRSAVVDELFGNRSKNTFLVYNTHSETPRAIKTWPNQQRRQPTPDKTIVRTVVNRAEMTSAKYCFS
jgi:hypothetical protein